MIEQTRIVASDNLFDFDVGGRPAYFVRAMYEDFKIADLVAWLPDQPQHWWTRRGMVEVLGLPYLHHCELIQQPIAVWRTPERWAQHNGLGVVPLFWPLSRFTLARAGLPLIAEDLEHHREITKAYQRPQPQILLRDPNEVAA